MITITLENIKQNDPCLEGWATLFKANSLSKDDLTKEIPVSSMLDSNNLDDTLCILQFLPEHDLLWRKFAWWCAKRVVHNATDDRVSESLEVVERYCHGLATEAELIAARSLAESANRSAAKLVESSSSWSSVWSSARSAAWSAAAAASELAAWSAAEESELWIAAEAAARSAAESKLWSVSESAAEAAARSAAWSEYKAQESKLRRILNLGHWED